MQKKIIVLAIAALASAPAFADVSAYGIMDAGYYSSNSGATSSATTSGVASSGYSTSRLGFKGAMDMSEGLKGNFKLEAEIIPTSGSIVSKDSTIGAGTAAAPASGNINLFKRNSTVGLSGDFGAIDIGRQNTPEYSASAGFDATGSNTGGIVPFFGATSQDRVDNSIQYTSPVFSGFTVKVLYSSQYGNGLVESNTVNTAGNFSDAQVSYSNSAASAVLGTQKANDQTGAIAYTNAYFMAKYDFGVAAVSAGYITKDNQVSGLENTKHQWIGVNFPVTSTVNVGAIYQSVTAQSGTSGKDSKGYGLVATYALSKQAKLYGAYSAVNNQNGAAVGTSVATGGTFTGTSTATTSADASTLMAGMALSF